MPPQLNRLFIIFAFIVAAFVAMRWVARPQSFGEYGHYRGDALSEAIQRKPAYVLRTSCAECHDEESAKNSDGPHKKISCQTCHGPGSTHCAEPATDNIQHPQPRALCLRCHETLPARPVRFPQISEPDHADGALCNTCHDVHNPATILE
jgi:hypothetical protein